MIVLAAALAGSTDAAPLQSNCKSGSWWFEHDSHAGDTVHGDLTTGRPLSREQRTSRARPDMSA